MYSLSSFAAVCFLGLTIVGRPVPAAPPAPAAANLQNADPDVRLLLGRANLERVRAKKPLLDHDPLLCKVALAVARDRDATHPLNHPGAASNFPDAPRETAAYFRDALPAADKNKPAYERFDENVCYEPVGPVVGKTKATLNASSAWEKWLSVPDEAVVCLDEKWTAMGAAVYRSPGGSVCIVAVYAAAAAPAAKKPSDQKTGRDGKGS